MVWQTPAPMTLALACTAAFLAGLVDAVAGGGGLIQLPALLVLFPESPVPLMLGTNKVASVAGTSAALVRYARAVALPWATVAPAAAAAFIGSFGGARLATVLPTDWMRPVVLVLLVVVLVQTLTKKDLGAREGGPHPAARLRATVLGAALGLYDGFFGPGTGSFLLFGLVAWIGFDFLAASASAKLVNVATNLAAILAFASAGLVRWEIAAPMALANVAGSRVGTHIALARGAPFVRKLFIAVVTALLLRMAWELAPR